MFACEINTRVLEEACPDFILCGARFVPHNHGKTSYVELEEAQRAELVRKIATLRAAKQLNSKVCEQAIKGLLLAQRV